MGGKRGVQDEGTRAPVVIHVHVWQKPSQYCKVIILQLINFKKCFPLLRGNLNISIYI